MTSNEDIMKVVKPAICAKLKSPASAQFPVDLISIVGDDLRGYKVDGFVDSQNGYGAMIRNDFTAEVKIQNGFPKVVSSYVAVKADAERAKSFTVNYILISIITAALGFLGYIITKIMVEL